MFLNIYQTVLQVLLLFFFEGTSSIICFTDIKNSIFLYEKKKILQILF